MPAIQTTVAMSVTQTTTLAVDFVLNYTANSIGESGAIWLMERIGGVVVPPPSLFNYGTVSSFSSIGSANAINIGDGGVWEGARVENHGSLTATSVNNDARGITANSWCPSIVNTGQINVEAQRGEAIGIHAYTPNINRLPFSINNSGLISSVGAHAWALYILSSTIVNTGTLSATGGALGAFTIVTAHSSITNGGSIIAVDTSPTVTSVAVAFSSIGANGLRDNELFNSGLISGEVAIAEMYEANSQTRLTNTGEIRGTIDLLSGEDVVRNSGLIVGNIRLGTGTDLYDGRNGGRVTGLVDGGGDTDTALFSGPRSAYAISFSGGVTTIRFISSGETTRLSGFERFRFEDGLFDASGESMQDIAIVGTLGDDALLQGTGDTDTIYGLEGDDGIVGGVGDDIIDGGAGRDVAVFSGRSTGYTIARSGDVMTVSGRDGVDTLRNIEVLAFEDLLMQWGGASNDLLFGSAGADTIYGLDGDDVIDGINGWDFLYGGRGDDRFVFAEVGNWGGGVGAVEGGEGFDTLDLRTLPNGGITALDDGSFLLSVGFQTYAVTDVERVFGRTSENAWVVDEDVFDFSRYDRNIEVRAGTGDDRLTGGDGDDILDGGDGVDVMDGSNGNDLMFGGAGADNLLGGSGNDILIGGAGNDHINGDLGYDIAGYGGVRRAYAISTGRITGGPEGGTDTLFGIEDLAFTDGRLTFARDGQAAQVMRLYDAAFNRAPDQSGFEALLDTLENGSLTLQQLANAFISSTEFQSQYAGLTNQQFVEQLYQFCLNRAGDSGGIQTWTNALNGGMSRGEVLLAFSESSEHKDLLQGQLDQGLWVADELTLQIARLYDATYDRLPDQGGLATWRNALGGGMSLIAIAQAFATAPEFQARYGSLSNQAFVELMYQLCLNRNGDAQGIQTWTNALNGGMSRGEVLMFFSESAEHVALTRSTWLGGVPCTDVAAPAPVLPEDKHDDAGAQVIPMVADAGTDASHDGKDGGAQVLPGADTAHDGKDAGSDDGVQVIPVVADGADTGGKDAGPQVLPGATDDEAPVAGKDTAPLILPGVIDSVTDDGFLLAKTDGDTGPQILPGAADDGADFLFDTGADAVDAGHDLAGLNHRLAMLFIETGEHAPGLDTGADGGPLNQHHNPDPWAA